EHVFKRTWHHTNHGVAVVVERDLASDDRRIASEATSPQCVAENHDVWAAEPIVGRLKVPSQERRHAQHTKIAGAHELAIEALRLPRGNQRRLPNLRYGNGREGTTSLREFAIGMECHAAARALRREFRYHHDPASGRVR